MTDCFTFIESPASLAISRAVISHFSSLTPIGAVACHTRSRDCPGGMSVR
jgi:hypothetical protein